MILSVVVALGIAATPSAAETRSRFPLELSAYQPTINEKLRTATFNGNLNKMKALLARGAKVNWADDGSGWTALIWATIRDEHEAVKFLLAKGADPNLQDESGWTALRHALLTSYTDIMETLLTAGARIDMKDRRGLTILMEAAFRGKEEVARLLLAKGADPNAKGKRGITALSLAALKGHRQVVGLLLAKGAVPDAKAKKALASVRNTGFQGDPARSNWRTGGVVFVKRSYGHAIADPRVVQANSVTDLRTRAVGRLDRIQGPHTSLHRGQPNLQNVQRIIQSIASRADGMTRGPTTLGRNGDQRAEAQRLLKQALGIWNQIRTLHPDIAGQLLESARAQGSMAGLPRRSR